MVRGVVHGCENVAVRGAVDVLFAVDELDVVAVGVERVHAAVIVVDADFDQVPVVENEGVGVCAVDLRIVAVFARRRSASSPRSGPRVR